MESFLQQRRRDWIMTSHADRDLSVDRPELDDDKDILKMQKDQRKRVEKDSRDRRTREHDDPEHDNNRDFNLQRFPDKKRLGRKIEGFASNDERDTFKSESINFFDSLYSFIICKLSFLFLF